MIYKEMPIEKFNRLKECEVYNPAIDKWNTGFRFVRKGRCYSTVAFLYNGNILQLTHRISNVRLTIKSK